MKKVEVIKELESIFKLAPNDDSYLRILVKDYLLDLKTGKTRYQRAHENYERLHGGRND